MLKLCRREGGVCVGKLMGSFVTSGGAVVVEACSCGCFTDSICFGIVC